eukprot:m.210838 g.210838  ORF g.210838 m.210838 type:complete len:451 (-) comp53966_c0_seq5:38-1390(-)
MPAANALPLVLLVCFGFFKEMKPSEPFLTPYLTDDKGITNDQLDDQVYPVWTYAYLVALFVVLVITDYVHYRPIVILEALACLATRVLLIWGSSLFAFQVMQMTYGVNSAAEVAYYASVYRLVPKERFLRVTSLFRVAVLTGQTLAAILAQVLVSAAGVSYLDLNYISFSSVCVAVLLAAFLSTVSFDTTDKPSVAPVAVQEDAAPQEFGDDDELLDLAQPADPSEADKLDINPTPSASRKLLVVLTSLWQTFLECYRNKNIRRWCIWWILATCGDFQVENYMSNLWEEISPSMGNSDVYNGGVTAAATLAGIVIASLCGHFQFDWGRWSEIVLGVLSLVDCAVLAIASQTANIWVAYAMYVIFAAIYTLLITIITAEVAKALVHENYAFVFGFNMFFALALQTILTSVVNNDSLNIPIREQFEIYSAFFGFIFVIFVSFSLAVLCSRRR